MDDGFGNFVTIRITAADDGVAVFCTSGRNLGLRGKRVTQGIGCIVGYDAETTLTGVSGVTCSGTGGRCDFTGFIVMTQGFLPLVCRHFYKTAFGTGVNIPAVALAGGLDRICQH